MLCLCLWLDDNTSGGFRWLVDITSVCSAFACVLCLCLWLVACGQHLRHTDGCISDLWLVALLVACGQHLTLLVACGFACGLWLVACGQHLRHTEGCISEQHLADGRVLVGECNQMPVETISAQLVLWDLFVLGCWPQV